MPTMAVVCISFMICLPYSDFIYHTTGGIISKTETVKIWIKSKKVLVKYKYLGYNVLRSDQKICVV